MFFRVRGGDNNREDGTQLPVPYGFIGIILSGIFIFVDPGLSFNDFHITKYGPTLFCFQRINLLFDRDEQTPNLPISSQHSFGFERIKRTVCDNYPVCKMSRTMMTLS